MAPGNFIHQTDIDPKDALQKAIDLAGGQTALASLIKKRQSTIRSYLVRPTPVPPEVALDIEEALNYRVTREELCPVFRDPRLQVRRFLAA